MRKYIALVYLPLLAMLLLSSSVAQCEKKEDPSQDNDKIDKDSILVSEYAISPGKNLSASVSNLLMGFNLIYPHEKNEIWEDGKIAGFMKEVNVAFLRYPGGTVCSFYHWNALTGEGWKDSWDPQNPVTPKAPSEFMDIDEYIALVRTTGAIPLAGINMSSGWRWNRQNDGLNEAIALMQYCKNRNFKVDYWYLDNEPYQDDSNGGAKTPEQYASLINTYVPAMKAYNPDIKIIANWNAGFKNKRTEYDKLIKLAGANIDIIDVHWYWSWNDASWEKWLEKTPMVQWTGNTYEDDIQYFRQMVKDLDYPDIQLASFEWNTGPVKLGNSLTASRVAFVHAEMMMQFISGGLDYAVLWPVHWPDEASIVRSFVNTSTNSANPDFHLFKFLGKMQGGTLTGIHITRDAKEMVSIAVLESGQKTLRICVLNKNTKDLVSDIEIDKFPGMILKEAQMYSVSTDGSKFFLENVKVLKSGKDEITKFISKSISLTLLTFTEK
jgi:alpha-L-arabinofuranosidase